MKDCIDKKDCTGRREFLVKAGLVAGGLVLTLSAPLGAFAGAFFEDLVVPIDDKSPLNKVGGSAVVESTAGKIIIMRTGETVFVAFSAKCTHKGGTVFYDEESKTFLCPKHGSEFNTANGSVVKGPAGDPLASYQATGTATSVKVKLS